MIVTAATARSLTRREEGIAEVTSARDSRGGGMYVAGGDVLEHVWIGRGKSGGRDTRCCRDGEALVASEPHYWPWLSSLP